MKASPLVTRVRAAVARGLGSTEVWPTAREVAQALGCSRQQVYKLAARGELEARDVSEHGVKIRRFEPGRVRKLAADQALSFVISQRPTPKPVMMTRGQVARTLGKSIATVRRLEGVLLHPRLTAGVWRFERSEVETLAAELREGRRLFGDFSGFEWPEPTTDPALPKPRPKPKPERTLPPNTIELCQSCAGKARAALRSSHR